MARPPKNPFGPFGGAVPSNLSSWAESLGEALGRGVARGINAGLAGLGGSLGLNGAAPRRGRPPKYLSNGAGPVPADKRCTVAGCMNPARSKGLCSKHYQAQRREQMKKPE